MAKGKWAQGIEPRHFQWVIADRLAICERPGGYGVNHRPVRRQEEIIWIRENNFDFVVSLIPAEDNLQSYDELGVRWQHWPLGTSELAVGLATIYPQLDLLISSGKRIVLHTEEVGDRLLGFIGGYLRWSGMVPVTYEAITVAERLFGRQLSPEGRELVAVAEQLADRSESTSEA